MKTIPRISKISREQFVEVYLTPGTPVIVTDCVENTKFSISNFRNRFGDEKVRVYDNLFNLQTITSLGNYISEYIDSGRRLTDEIIPYARLYSYMGDAVKTSENDNEWSDTIFQNIANEWSMPYFLPKENYLLPLSNRGGPL